MTPFLKTAALPVALLGLLLVVPVFVEDSYTRHLFIIAFIYAVIASNWNLSLAERFGLVAVVLANWAYLVSRGI